VNSALYHHLHQHALCIFKDITRYTGMLQIHAIIIIIIITTQSRCSIENDTQHTQYSCLYGRMRAMQVVECEVAAKEEAVIM
jgi:hypothetical protein